MPAIRTPADEIRELEAMWRASPVRCAEETSPSATACAATRTRLPLVPGPALGWTWLALLVASWVLAPAQDPAAAPSWFGELSAVFYLTLLAAGLVGAGRPRLGFAAATVAGGLGVELWYVCTTSGDAWSFVFLAASGALTAVTATGFVQRLRRE